MHPALGGWRGFLVYLALWTPIIGLLVVLLAWPGGLGWIEGTIVALPLTLVYAYICLGAYYVAQTVPIRGRSPLALAGVFVVASILSSSLWLLVARGWFLILGYVPMFETHTALHRRQLPMLFAIGVLLFGLALAIYYLLAAFEQAREAESRALEARVLAVEAELRALRAQIDPHFLFNSLHSIGALAGSDPAAARNMSQRLGDFLRASLKFGAMADIALADELALAEHYLSVERVRYGSRLQVSLCVPEETKSCRVPPLILQPLVENAVTHGIAHLVEGGTVTLSAERNGEHLEIAVENPCDPDRRTAAGVGVGLDNVRMRLDALFGRRARVDVFRSPERFRVEVTVPIVQLRT